jgi:hypothetical protein
MGMLDPSKPRCVVSGVVRWVRVVRGSRVGGGVVEEELAVVEGVKRVRWKYVHVWLRKVVWWRVCGSLDLRLRGCGLGGVASGMLVSCVGVGLRVVAAVGLVGVVVWFGCWMGPILWLLV